MRRSALLAAWQHDNPPFPVWPDNWDAVQLFLHAGTQWRLDAAGGRAGLDYPALQWPMQALRLRGRRALRAFTGLQAMEAAYLKHSHAAQQRQQRRQRH